MPISVERFSIESGIKIMVHHHVKCQEHGRKCQKVQMLAAFRLAWQFLSGLPVFVIIRPSFSLAMAEQYGLH
jgi:hypothetical protein